MSAALEGGLGVCGPGTCPQRCLIEVYEFTLQNGLMNIETGRVLVSHNGPCWPVSVSVGSQPAEMLPAAPARPAAEFFRRPSPGGY